MNALAGNVADRFDAMKLRSPSNVRLGVKMGPGGGRRLCAACASAYARRSAGVLLRAVVECRGSFI